jgi:hypothetical protein
MSFTSDNIVSYVTNNPEEAAGVFNSLHVLIPGTQAFMKLCADNSVRPLRRAKGQYKTKKKKQSAFNLFTSDQRKGPEFKSTTFSETATEIGVRWKNLKENNKIEYDRYLTLADDMKDNNGNGNGNGRQIGVDEVNSDVSVTIEIDSDGDTAVNDTAPTVSKAKKVKTKTKTKTKIKTPISVTV